MPLFSNGGNMRNELLRIRRKMRQRLRRISTAQIILLAFAAIILLGGLLLMLPIAAKSRTSTDFRTALFTATSATCVTGLSVVETFTHWSGFGQTVILLLIQIGGLGFMTIVSLFFFALHHRVGLKQRMLMAMFPQISRLL